MRRRYFAFWTLCVCVIFCTIYLLDRDDAVTTQLLAPDPQVAILDASRLYLQHPFFWNGDATNSSLCLATHASLEHVKHLGLTARLWKAEVSVALFLPGIDFHLAAIFVRFLQRCTPYGNQMRFHVVHPLATPADVVPLLEVAPLNCSAGPAVLLEELLALRPANSTRLQYPQNVLRNLALSGCSSPFVLSADVDMLVPSENFVSDISLFLQDEPCDNCAYVIPVYEVDSSVKFIPRTKKELLKLRKEKLTRPFHVEVFDLNQKQSQLNKWEALPEVNGVHASYQIEYKFFYEPVFVAHNSFPNYDERFIGYGNTRNTQVLKMFLAGWKFHILDNAFLVHWGFQTIHSYPEWRVEEIRTNKIRFQTFLREMVVHYDKDPLKLLNDKRFFNQSFNILVQSKPKPKKQKETRLTTKTNKTINRS